MRQRAAYVGNRIAEKFEARGRIVHETNDAVLFQPESWTYGVWIPNSQIFAKHREFAFNGYDRVVMSAWIAKKKGLI